MNVFLTTLLFLVAISNADNCQHWSVCNQNSDPIDPLDPVNPVKRGKMGPKGEKGSPGPDMSNEIRNLEEITKVFVAEMSIFNETLSTQRDKIYLLEQEKEDMIELITNQSKKLQKLEVTILKQDEKLNSFNKIISDNSTVQAKKLKQLEETIENETEDIGALLKLLSSAIRKDCKSIKEWYPSAESGRFVLDNGIEVVCEMNVDGGGWTMFQRRFDGSVNFTQNWNKYSEGFGSLDTEFWLGLENVHKLTKEGDYDLRINMVEKDGTEKYAQYRNFKISDSSDYYRLTFDENSYSGDARDALYYHNGKPFSTYDADHDSSSDNCVTIWGSGGGNWMNICYNQDLNGLYTLENAPSNARIFSWYNTDPLVSSKMMFRRTS